MALGLAGACLLSGGAYAQEARRSTGYLIIVHPSNPVTAMRRAEVADLFLKRRVNWSTGVSVAPVDLPSETAARQAFSREVLGKSPKAVATYWIQEIFANRATPPVVKSTPAGVVALVAETPGGIGYVPVDVATTGVNVLTVVP
jgi:ABC-type phosphate transport system substrate-binding protein